MEDWHKTTRKSQLSFQVFCRLPISFVLIGISFVEPRTSLTLIFFELPGYEAMTADVLVFMQRLQFLPLPLPVSLGTQHN